MLSLELWSRACLDLDSNPRHVLMMVCTVKGLSEALGDSWWEAYWRRHQAKLAMKRHCPHWYLRTDALGILRRALYRPLLTLVYAKHCSVCGNRYRHSINHQLKIRICRTCGQDSLVSNAALYFEYGIEMTEIVAKYERFVKFFPMHDYKPSEIATLSRNPIDVVPCVTRQMVFFWRPDIASIYDLPRMRAAQIDKIARLNVIKAAIKRRYAQAHRLRHLVEILHVNELRRIKHPLMPARWCVGGAQKLAWRFHRNRESPSLAQIAQRRMLQARLRMLYPVPLMAYNEYVLKTAIQKLTWKKCQTMTWDDDHKMPQKIYKI